MRSRLSVGLVMLCLGLAGCGLFQKNKNENTGKPFKGLPNNNQDPAPATPGNTVAATDPNLPQRVDGVVAGKVLTKGSNQGLKMAQIEVVDLDKGRKAPEAPIFSESDQGGFFYIRGLEKGKHYQLIARARDGQRILAGAELVTPPNIHVCIMLTEDRNPPGDVPWGPQPLPGQAPLSNGPAASLGIPIRPDASIVPPVPPGPPSAGAQPPVAPDRMADMGGFQKAPVASIPAPADIPPPPPIYPPAPPVDTRNPSGPQTAVPGSYNRYSDELAHAPSCALVGERLENMALRTLDGNIWEYKRNRRGRLLLLSFWSSSCVYCKRTNPHLCDLQKDFGRYGLEVIGIACEDGSPAESEMRVRAARNRQIMTFQTLLSGPRPCPVATQFQVDVLPKVFLLDEYGAIVWKSGRDGLSPEKLLELRQMITLRLRVQGPGSR